jgi:hypothetical protein
MRATPQQASSLDGNSGSLAQVDPLRPGFRRAYHVKTIQPNKAKVY